MKRLIYLVLGCFSLLIGIVGIVLPIVPTTPLLLLAGFCFARSSRQFEKRLRASRLYQFYVADYAETRSIALSRKKRIIWQIYALMGLSIYLAPLIWVKLALSALTLLITYYLFKVIPNKKED